jgi:hypothetical protein
MVAVVSGHRFLVGERATLDDLRAVDAMCVQSLEV